jgi:hypothetical protein
MMLVSGERLKSLNGRDWGIWRMTTAAVESLIHSLLACSLHLKETLHLVPVASAEPYRQLQHSYHIVFAAISRQDVSLH